MRIVKVKSCRWLSATILGLYASLNTEFTFPNPQRSISLKIILKIFFSVYPADIWGVLKGDPAHFDRSKYVSPDVAQQRITILSAVSGFLKYPEAQEITIIAYFDELLRALCRDGVHPLLQAAALKLINQSLPKTNLSRRRVDSLFRAPILQLGQKLKDLKTTNANWETQIHQFFCIWYPRPPDDILEAVTDVEKALSLGGYSFLRKQYLSKEGSKMIEFSSHANLTDLPAVSPIPTERRLKLSFLGEKLISLPGESSYTLRLVLCLFSYN
jgi:hypothetical protein